MSGPWHPTGRARVSARSPRAFGVCDRCGFTYQRSDLSYQYQWQGFVLQNLNWLVCDTCLDVPQVQLKSIILPPDPVPIDDPRIERYSVEVPSYMTTETQMRLVTVSGDPLVTSIRVTPSPDPNNPYYFVEA